ncbi:unnamed protein product [Gemmata massiliana]|uniref:Uncharacterized protein n=1 Tax=Gemmata massiliana TaxID=1210884 RepID=A0A6P2DET7_9BACT|nr:hypothetical protein [Gemmata massiliana]VTS00166.1 unnamed protein product [Gemmata massiliana]
MTPLLLSLALTSPAQPPIYTPPVTLAPRVTLQPQITPAPVYRPVVVVPVPVVVNPVVPAPVGPRAVTLSEFSRFFTPTPGQHDVWIIHPVTRQPVRVCFALPNGKLRDFEVDRRSIRFEFRNGVVDIEFRNNGTVDVRYRD